MDFAMLPPEINSARMYAGPGSSPMLAAAQTWEGLAAELHAAASSYQSVLSGLTAGPWQGASSASMAAAAAAYVAWLNTTATQAEETAVQAKAAAAAYATAFASMVPPPVIAANRSLLTRLVTNNLFGQNTSAIATTEAQYAEMWAQDAATMYSYAGSSAPATALTPFSAPPQNTNPGAPASQAAAVSHAIGTSAGTVQNTISNVPQAFSAVPNALQSLATAAPAATAIPPLSLTTLANLITIFIDLPAGLATLVVDTPMAPLAAVSLPYDIVGTLTGLHTDDIVSGWAGVESWPGTGTQPPTEFPAIITHPNPAPASVSAGIGEANTVGALSVPATWTIATPAVRPVSALLPALPPADAAAVGEAVEVGAGSMFGEMALAGMAGAAMTGTLGRSGGRHGAKATAGTRLASRAGGAVTTGDPQTTSAEDQSEQSTPRTVVTGVAAELREFAKLRDEGILTDEEFAEQKNRLLGR